MALAVSFPRTVSYNGTATVSASFTDSTGAAADPGGLTFAYQPQSGSLTTLTYGTDAALVKDSTGHYHVNLTGNTAGLWTFEYTGTGSNAAAYSGYFYVTPNPLGGSVSPPVDIDLTASDGASHIGFVQTETGAVASTVQDVLRYKLHVKEFGAIGNGTANDTTALQNALNALSSNTDLCICKGTYKVTSQLTTPTGLQGFRISGEGARASKLDCGAAISGGALLKVFNCQNFTIDNIAFWGESLADYGLWLDSNNTLATSNYRIIGCDFIKCPVEGIRVADSIVNNYEIDFGTYLGCSFYGNGHNVGVHSSNSIEHNFYGCQMAASGATQPTHNVYIENGGVGIFGCGFASASQYDIYKGPSSFLHIDHLYSESSKLINAAGGGSTDYTTIIKGYIQNVNNDGTDVISWSSANGLVLEGCRFGGNVNVASAANFAQVKHCVFHGTNSIVGTGSALVDNPPQHTVLGGSDTTTTWKLKLGSSQSAVVPWQVIDNSSVAELDYNPTSGEAGSVYAGLTVYRNHTLTNLASNAAYGVAIKGKSDTTRMFLIGYSPTEETAWLQTFRSGVAFEGTIKIQSQGGNVQYGGAVQKAKGAPVASANNLTLGADGNLFHITGNTTINAITATGWQAGSEVTMIFDSNPTVKNNTAGGGGTAKMLLSGSVDMSATANDTLTLVYDGTSWFEKCRTVI